MQVGLCPMLLISFQQHRSWAPFRHAEIPKNGPVGGKSRSPKARRCRPLREFGDQTAVLRPGMAYLTARSALFSMGENLDLSGTSRHKLLRNAEIRKTLSTWLSASGVHQKARSFVKS